MHAFDERYTSKLMALHVEMGLQNEDDTEIRIWHILRALLELCDAQSPRLDFDLILENVRSDFK